MGKIETFTDLEAWKESHKLTLLIYKYTSLFPKHELFAYFTVKESLCFYRILYCRRILSISF